MTTRFGGRTRKAAHVFAGMVALLVLSGPGPAAAEVRPTDPDHAGCESATKVVRDLREKYGELAGAIGCVVVAVASEGAVPPNHCMKVVRFTERIHDEMVAFWNALVRGGWATIGPRRMEFSGSADGQIVSHGTRMFITPSPVDENQVEIRLTKDDGRLAVDVTVCLFDAEEGGRNTLVRSYEIPNGNGNKGRTWTTVVDDTYGRFVSVVLVGKAVDPRTLDYTFQARKKGGPLEALPTARADGGGSAAADFGAPEPGDAYGGAVVMGDFDGDGHVDVAIGAPGEARGSAPRNSGVVFLYRGQGGGGLDAWMILDQSDGGQVEANDRFGAALAAGDFDGDGILDLAVGAPGEAPGSAPASGYVNLFRGTRSGLRSWGGLTQEGLGRDEAGDHFGGSLTAGDLNGDGKDDLVVGAPGERVGDVRDTGHVFLFRGTARGLEPWKTLAQGEEGS